MRMPAARSRTRTARHRTVRYLAAVAALALIAGACAADDDDADADAPDDDATEEPDDDATEDDDGDEAAEGLDEFPCDQVDFIVPQAAGGGSDLYTRTIAQEVMGPILDTQVNVRNVPGDGQMLGLSEVAQAEPDGCTWTTFNPPSVTLSIIARGDDAPLDVRDFEYAGVWGSVVQTLVARPELGVETIDDVIEMYENGDYDLMGVQDTAGQSHINAVLMQEEWGMQFEDLVHYDSAEIVAAFLRDEVLIGVSSDANVQDHLASGELVGIAVLGDDERDIAPGVAPAADQGYESIAYAAASTRMLAMTPGVPEDVRQMIEDALREALESDEIQSWAEDTGNAVEFRPGEEAKQISTDAFQLEETVPGLREMLEED